MRGVVISLMIAASLAGPVSEGCAGSSFWSGCSINNSGTQLDIGGSYTQPGAGTQNAVGNPDGGAQPTTPVRMSPRERGSPDCAPDSLLCVPVYEDGEPAEQEEDDGIPEVTLADLVSFAPARPDLQAEPSAAGIVGMPTNFVAQAQEQTLSGTLFGRPVTVRFTPVAFVFDHGDGSTTRSADGGAPWEALGQPQFSATPTSHAYAERGSYTASVTVEYAPAVDFGTGWMPVAGVVTATAGDYGVQVYELRTALVDRTCLEHPAGPAC